MSFKAELINKGCIPLRISDPRSVWIMVHQSNRWIHNQNGFIGSFNAPIPWCREILDYWSWSRSSQRVPKELSLNQENILKRPSQGKLKLANSCWQTQVGVCERLKNSRQTRFYLTPTVCKRVCRLFLCRTHTPTWFANTSLPTSVCRVKAALVI